MKHFFSVITLLFLTISGFAQMEKPITWTTHTEKVNETTYNLVLKADIKEHWHLYCQHSPEGGSLALEISSEQAGKDISLNGEAAESATEKAFNKVFGVEEEFFKEQAVLKQEITLLKPEVKEVKLSVFGQVCLESCLLVQEDFTFDLSKATTDIMPIATAGDKPTTKKEDVVVEKDKERKKQGLLARFFLSFVLGLAALLTPCVFPMIPMTVSFFLKQSKTRAKGISNAIVYGTSIVIIYVLLGVVVSAVFGSDAMNEFSTGALFNLVFFFILVIFALSFLGAFEIVLPSSWSTKVDAQIDKTGGYVGIFLMALALAIVSFSCTLPIVGSALAEASQKGFLAPIISMLGFSSGIAVPFMLFAIFPSWLNSLPKSGGWLNTVKVFLGFLELAFAFKFLSNADLVYDLHWFEREVFIAVWIAVFGAMALYLFGKIKLPHDDDTTRISVGRLMLGLLALAFTVYLIPGLWGAPLKIVSGFPPPLKYAESPYGVGYTKEQAFDASLQLKGSQKMPEHAHLGPHDIIAFEDYDHGMAYAKKVGKPVLLDFTGKACVNCRKMEDYVWSDPAIKSTLRNDVVLISLYVDYREELPEDEQYVSAHTGKKIKTVGNKWSEFQAMKYKTNTQPYYVLLNHNEEMLEKPYTYNSDINAFNDWLTKGVKNFK